MRRLPYLCLCVLLNALSPSLPAAGVQGDPAPKEASHERLLETLERMHFFGPQTLPTAPRPVARLVPEWHPSDSVILSIHSLPTVLGLEASYKQYADLVSRIIPMTPVIVLYPESEQTLLGELIARLESKPGIQQHRDRLSFFAVAGPTMWIRDNGPLFGRLEDGSLAVLDFASRAFVDETEAWQTIPSEIAGIEWGKEVEAFEANRRRERIADATPAGLIRHLRLRTGRELPMSRPPISLQGGDYVTDGRGNIFISQETLMANGGDRESLEEAFQEHVGSFRLHYLFPLPGNTPKHLDMVVKFVDENTVILATPPPPAEKPLTPYLRRLRQEIEDVLAYNRRYFQSTFPDLRIVEIPLPPVLDEPPSRILNRLRWRIFAKVCELNGLDILQLLKGEGAALAGETQQRLFEAIERDLGTAMKLETLEELQAASLHYLKLDLNTIIETNVPYQTLYRSPVNSIHLIDTEGHEKFILPRFTAREDESPEELKLLERQAEKAYREARPEAVIEWVPADVAADLQGGLHCMAITLPAQSGLQEETGLSRP